MTQDNPVTRSRPFRISVYYVAYAVATYGAAIPTSVRSRAEGRGERAGGGVPAGAGRLAHGSTLGEHQGRQMHAKNR